MKHRFFVVLSLLPLAGCALWSDFERPETPAPERWQGEVSAASSSVSDDWWKQFNAPALTVQIEEAARSNYDLKAAVARVRQADAQVRINGASLLPSIDASGSARRDRTPGGRVSSTGISSNPRIANSYIGSLSASYEFDFWGKNWAEAESARQLAEASRFDHETVRLTTLGAVADTWFDIVATQERLAVANANLAGAQEVQDAIRQRLDLGLASALDMARQESVVASQRAAIPPLQDRLRRSLDAQAVLLGKLPEAPPVADTTLAGISLPEVTPGIPSELLQRRPDVQAAEAALASAHADIVSARAAFFPSISLTAEGGVASSALARLFNPDSILWALGASVAQPIFDGGRLSGEVDLAKARYDEQLQNYRKAAIAAFSDVEDALSAVQQGRALEEAQKQASRTASEAYDLSQQQLEAGLIDITVLLDTQRTLFSTQDALLQARLAHLQAIVGLYKALGGGWKNG